MVMNMAPIPNVSQPVPLPYLGLTESEQTTLSYVPSVAGEPTTTKPAAYDPLSRLPSVAFLGRVTGGAIGPENDPATWTPGEAAEQTDRALARIATANPELAKSLAEARGKSVDEDLPWYKDILKGVGDFLHATKLDVVFDYLTRASRIVPEVIHDWGKESAWENIGDALSGESTISWDDVLVDNFGMERSWLTATLGFVGDVATDPITYMTFGMGGIGRAAAAKSVSTAGLSAALKRGSLKVSDDVAERLVAAGHHVGDGGMLDLSLLAQEVKAAVSDDFLAAVARKGGTEEDAIAKAIFSITDVGKELAEKGGAGLTGRLRTALGGVHPDARSGALFTADQIGSREALLQAVRFQDDLYRQATTGGWNRVSKEAAEVLGIGKGEVDTILRSYVSQGTGVGVSKAAYREGKAAAAALGGARLRFSIPVLNIRAAGMRLPIMPRNMDFSIGRRFFAGISGQVRLMKMVGNGSATMEDMRIFWEEGFSGLKRLSPGTYNRLGKGVRSAFFTASEGLGGATAHLSPHAMQLRGGGLAAKYAGETRVQARHIATQSVDEIQTVVLRNEAGGEAQILTGNQVALRVGTAAKNAGDRADVLTDRLNELANLVPEPGVGASKYWDGRILAAKQQAESAGRLNTDEVQETLARMEHDKARAVQAEAEILQLSGGDAELGEIWRQVARNRDNVEINAGRAPDSYNDEVITIDDLPTDDARRYSNGQTYVSDQVHGSSGIGVEELSDNGVTGVPLRGVRSRPAGHLDDPVPSPQADDVQARSRLSDKAEAEAQDDFVANLEKNIAKTEDEIVALSQPKVHPLKNTENAPDANAKIDEDLNATFEAATDEGYGYHWGPRTGHEGRKSKGLLPSVPADADIAGGFPSGVYFGSTGKRAYDLTPPKGARDSILYRVRKDRLGKSPSKNADELVSEKAIAAGDVEYLAADGTWKPLKAADLPTAAGDAPLSPAAAIVQLDPELQRFVQQNLDPLDPAEQAWRKQPRLVSTGPERILTIDRAKVKAGGGGTQATEVVDEVAEIQDMVRPLLDEVESGTHPQLDNLSDEASEELRRIVATVENKDAQLADITTLLLKQRGYTGVRIITDEGEELVSFMDDVSGHVPLSRVNDRAPFVPDHGGSQLRAVTQEAREAVQGINRRKHGRLIQKILRQVKDLPRDKAEQRARELLEEAHITLRPDQRFFESDPLRILEEASNESARRVAQQFTGEAIRHAENLGLTRGAYGAQAVGLGRYRVVISENGIDLATSVGDEVAAAANVIARLSDETGIASMRQTAARLTDEHVEVEAALNELRDNAQARKQTILNDLGLKPELPESYLNEETVRKVLADKQAEFSRMRFEGDKYPRAKELDATETLEQVGEAAEDGSTIFLRRGRDSLTFYHIAPDGRTVTGVRNRRIPDKGWNMATRYGPEEEIPIQGTVDAFTAPAMQGQGIGEKLLRADWDEIGVTSGTPEEQFRKMAEAIAVQDLSTAGKKLNQRAVVNRTKEILAEASKREKDLARRAKRAADNLQGANVEYQEAVNELNRLTARASQERSPVLAALVPVEDAENMTGMATLRVPGFEDFRMPAFMAEEFEGAMRGFPKLEGPHLAFRQFNNWWKQFATWLVPGFHMRNIQGAFFNNWLGGVGLRDYITSSRIRYAERELAKGKAAKWAKATIKDTDKELYEALILSEPSGRLMGRTLDQLTYSDLAQLSAGLNLTASNGRVFAEAQLTAEAQTQRIAKAAKGRRGYIDRVATPYVKTMRGAGTMTENVFRTASFVRGLREGRGVIESRAFTMMRHGDYEDLTDTEYLWVRDLIPFYKWMRTNTPFQVHQLLESPGKLLAVQKAQQAVYAGQGLDYEVEKHRMPAWMGEGFTIPHNVKKSEEGLNVYETVMLDLPMSDLFMGGREFVSSFLPTIRPFLESYVYNQQTFSGAPLTGKQEKLNPLLAPLAPVLDAVGLAKRGEDGEMYMSDKTSNLIGILPLYSRFKNFVYGDNDAVKRRSNTLASAIFGLQLRPVDAETLSSSELSFYYDQLLPTMTSLREQGYPLPTTDDIEATVGATDTILTNLGIQPGPVGAEAA